MDLSTKQVAFSNFSEPEKQTVDVSETPEDTHQTRVKSLTPPDSPESTPSSSPTPRQQPYSPTMPYYNPGSIGAVPEYTPTMRDELLTVGFPPKPIALCHILDLGIDIAIFCMTLGPFLLVPHLLSKKTRTPSMLIVYVERLCRLGSGQRTSHSVPMDSQLRGPSLYNRVTLFTNYTPH